MENQKKLTKEELEFYQKTNPGYFKQMAKYYNSYDKDYYINVVFPLINESNKKNTKRIFMIVLIVLGFIMLAIVGQLLKSDKITTAEKEDKKESGIVKDENTNDNSKQMDEITKDENNKDSDKKDESEKDETILEKYKVGSLVQVGNFIYRVNDILFKKAIGNEFINKTADGIFLLIQLQIMNISKEPRTLDNSMFKLIDEHEIEFETSSDLTTYLELSGKETLFLKKCQPQIKTSGILGFEVPDNKRNYYLKVSGGFWSGKTETILLQQQEESDKSLAGKNESTSEDKSNYTSSEYNGIYPQASKRYLTNSDVSGLSQWDLKIMRNEIFARHGYIFQTDEMKNYFSEKSWYAPKYSDVNNMLTKIEKENIALIKKFER